MSSIAIITARGGSKRIPRKNIRNFCGKPIIAYSIEAALKSGVFDEVMVSTDDEEIKAIAVKYGAKVPFMRSEKTANDYAMTWEVIYEVIETYAKQGKHFDYLCCIYPTAPFLTAERLKEGMETLIKEGADTVLPVVQFSFPPQRCFVIREENVSFLHPENAKVRSQDLEKQYHDAGQFYCLNTDRFMQDKSVIMPCARAVIMDEAEVQDIDNPSDWELAEQKYQLLYKKRRLGIPQIIATVIAAGLVAGAISAGIHFFADTMPKEKSDTVQRAETGIVSDSRIPADNIIPDERRTDNMRISFKDMEYKANEAFKGGEGIFYNKMFSDEKVKLFKGKLEPGSTIGYHAHETSCEVIYILEGSAKCIFEDSEVSLQPGDAHYCPKGKSHSLINDGQEDLVFFAVVPEQ